MKGNLRDKIAILVMVGGLVLVGKAMADQDKEAEKDYCAQYADSKPSLTDSLGDLAKGLKGKTEDNPWERCMNDARYRINHK